MGKDRVVWLRFIELGVAQWPSMVLPCTVLEYSSLGSGLLPKDARCLQMPAPLRYLWQECGWDG